MPAARVRAEVRGKRDLVSQSFPALLSYFCFFLEKVPPDDPPLHGDRHEGLRNVLRRRRQETVSCFNKKIFYFSSFFYRTCGKTLFVLRPILTKQRRNIRSPLFPSKSRFRTVRKSRVTQPQRQKKCLSCLFSFLNCVTFFLPLRRRLWLLSI